ncbi:MAG: hypothetical protein IKE21_02945 [Erysipelotrichaceae bacterium]|nr:hypothetical protein [Erysipelotrichaceae bacterium]
MICLQTPYEMTAEIARRFRQIRRRKKITIREVSIRSGVPYSTVRRFESTGEIALLSFVKIVSVIGEDREIERLLSERPVSIEEVIRGERS